ncbi:MAG: site-specific integrase [Candidatus Eisenbacteria bacterium]|nr:site-specific integrase [Candidatus Eisenbacteria bacterium]
MINELFRTVGVIARHRSAPMVKERESFLCHRRGEGCSRSTLLRTACMLLWAARILGLSVERRFSPKQIRDLADRWTSRPHPCRSIDNHRSARTQFIGTVSGWLRFLDRLEDPKEAGSDRILSADLIEDYESWMVSERGLAPETIEACCRVARRFLRWYETMGRPFAEVRLTDIDAFLTGSCGEQQLARLTIATMAHRLRAFFKYAGTRGWCSGFIAPAIRGPRLYLQENLPLGPTWESVGKIFASMETTRRRDIRDRAMLMLVGIYGLRSSEVRNLQIDDIDWENDRISVLRAKHFQRQIYPLIPGVGNAIVRYLREVRPACSSRNVFVRLRAPFRGLSRGALHHAVSRRVRMLGIETPRRGPHALRHACATHLLAEGLSLKVIGDHLGHRSSEVTRVYAKVDLSGLREVAAFDLGGVL